MLREWGVSFVRLGGEKGFVGPANLGVVFPQIAGKSKAQLKLFSVSSEKLIKPPADTNWTLEKATMYDRQRSPVKDPDSSSKVTSRASDNAPARSRKPSLL